MSAQGLTVFSFGQLAKLRNEIDVMIVEVSISGAECRVMYSVTWIHNGERKEAWVHPGELKVEGGEHLTIGFRRI